MGLVRWVRRCAHHAIDLYLYLQDFKSSLGDDNPDVVTDAAPACLVGRMYRIHVLVHKRPPDCRRRWEISREKWEETYEIHRQTRGSMLTPEMMTSEVYDHLCSELPHFVEE